MEIKRAEIFVLNFNGEELLKECLPSIVDAAKKSLTPCSVTVIDNDSKDGSAEILKRDFPGVKLRRSENRVLCSFNDAVREIDADIVLLLNNDLRVEPDFIEPLLEVFRRHEDAFLSVPKAYTFDRKQYEGGLAVMDFEKGLLRGESRFPGYENKVDVPGITMQAGGFAAYRRSLFLEVGGFDELYLPGTVEDADLCFRAWRAGYTCYYAPDSRLFHKGQATFKKHFRAGRLSAINQRNLHLFMWKNITDAGLWLKYLAWYPVRPVYFLIQGKPEFFRGALSAFGRLGAALQRRNALKKTPRLRTDREIFNISKKLATGA